MVKIILIFLFGLKSYASIDKAYEYFEKSRKEVKYYPLLAHELIEEGYYFSAVPLIKEYMLRINSTTGDQMNNLLEGLIAEVGTRQFEVLPVRILEKSRGPSIRYVLARKYFRTQEYRKALKVLGKHLSKENVIAPFSLMLKGSLFAILNLPDDAKFTFSNCRETAEYWLLKVKRDWRKRQLKMVRDVCMAGIPRVEFAEGKYEKSKSHYLDISKNSMIWPEVLFEEAWNAFYLKNFNRTLGKLVTYKAPLLKHIFNPEVDTLSALTYLELCLFDDVKVVVENFEREYANPLKAVKKFLKRNKKNYKVYYDLAKGYVDQKNRSDHLLHDLLNSVVRDHAFGELYQTFIKGDYELKILKKLPDSVFKNFLGKNLFDSLTLQRDLIGAYVRTGIERFVGQLETNLRSMRYIKLEMLAHKKMGLYTPKDSELRSRGDIKQVKPTSKQYFWSFNGEFWADELGDYIFSLKSECRE